MEPKPRAQDNVRALTRGLQILHEVNRSGGIRAAEVAQRLGIPRPTVYRLLETLEEMGFVERSATDNRMRVTRRALSLGDGFTPGVAFSQMAGHVLTDLGRRLVWPVNLTTYDNAAMVVQETTHSYSPLSVDRGMTGSRRSVLRTAAGYAYLAASAPQVRATILDHVRHVSDPADREYLDPDRLAAILETTERQGYGLRLAHEGGRSSIAVAIRDGETVFGCFSLIWVRTALPLARAVEQFVPEMRRSADAAARLLASAQTGPDLSPG